MSLQQTVIRTAKLLRNELQQDLVDARVALLQFRWRYGSISTNARSTALDSVTSGSGVSGSPATALAR